MAQQHEHLQKARANRTFAAALPQDDPTALGWAVVCMFYAALHFIEAYNAKFSHHCRTHHDVRDSIERNQILDPIWNQYLDLQNFSWDFRYNAVGFNKGTLLKAEQCLGAVEKHILPLL